MIAKIVPTPKGGGRFGNLGAYVAAGRRQASGLGPEGQGAEWSRLGSYVLDQAHGGEKVAASWTRNLGSEDLAWAIKLVEATQALARPGAGGKGGKTLHIVVSFAPGERLDVDTMKEIEERLARQLGVEEYHRIGGAAAGGGGGTEAEQAEKRYDHLGQQEFGGRLERVAKELKRDPQLDSVLRQRGAQLGVAERSRLARSREEDREVTRALGLRPGRDQDQGLVG